MSQDMEDTCSQKDKKKKENKEEKDESFLKPLLTIAVLYLLVQGLGIWISGGGFWVEKGVVDKVKDREIQPVVEDPENPESSAYIFIYIVIVTALLLLLMKYKFDLIIKIFMGLAFLLGLSFTFWNLLGTVGILLAVVFLAFGYWKRKNILVMNLVLIFTVPGIGSWLGASLSFLPALILLLGLAIYDIIAVFGTKHMVKLAEGAKDKVPLMFSVPVKERTLGLGTGDFALPVVFSTSILGDYGFTNSIFAVIGGLIGVIALFAYIFNKEDIALPALPPIAIGMIIGFGISLLF